MSALPFLTAYDPLGGTGGSIDPLGSLQSYGALADKLLPGLTTVTTRSRYLSMLCYALYTAEQHHTFPPGPAGLGQRRRAIEPFERLWALACVAADSEGTFGAADGLRGVRYATAALRDFQRRGDYVSPDFKLLKFQGRTGAVGTYWAALVGGALIDPNSGQLFSEGEELAAQFPPPPEECDEAKLADPDRAHRVALSFDTLSRWARKCHLSAAGPKERAQLREALTADHRRECVAQALRTYAHEHVLLDKMWDIPALRRLGGYLADDNTAVNLDLPLVIEAIIYLEQFHEAALAVFETLLWWGTENGHRPVTELAADVGFRRDVDIVRARSAQFLQFCQQCARPDVRQAIAGFEPFARALIQTANARDLLDEILRHHHRVQSGKIDGGMPKQDWVTSGTGDHLLRPAPQFQRPERPPKPTGRWLTHPYRIEPFVRMLRENEALPN